MGRRRSNYKHAGAAGKMSIQDIGQLDASRWVVQPKHDGCYAELVAGPDAKVVRVLGKNGQPLQVPQAAELIGTYVGQPNTVIAGELTGHTTAGVAEAEAIGFARVHAFDILATAGRDLRREPYRVRRRELMMLLAGLEAEGPDRHWYLDQHNRAHDRVLGRYTKRRPTSWRRIREVKLYPLSRAGQLWDQAKEGEIEGLVVVALDAPVAGYRAKLKAKPFDTLDCIVVSASPKRCTVRTFGRLFTVGCGGLDLREGQTVSVIHEGWYDSGEPRFPRIERVRTDLARAA